MGERTLDLSRWLERLRGILLSGAVLFKVISTECARASPTILGWVVLCFFLVHPAFARENIVPGSRYVSARGAAMGDAFLPMGREASSALFYNPAIFGKLRGVAFEAANLSGYGNFNVLSALGGNVFSVPQLAVIAPTLAATPETFVSAGTTLAPTFLFGRFGFGVLINGEIGAQANNNGAYRYRTLKQVIPSFGFGFPFFKGRLRVGYSLQWVNQANGDITQQQASDLDYNTGLFEGAGLSHMLGVAFKLGNGYFPEVNIVARNIGGLRFSSNTVLPLATTSVGTPAPESMTIDVSLSTDFSKAKNNKTAPSLFPGKTGKKGVNPTWVVQLRDLTNTSNTPIDARFATGVEIPTGNWAFRAGWGTGYPSAGLGYVSKNFEFGLTWYSEDIGQTYHELQDMRVLLQFQLSFR